jgi:hypothetical protein
VSEHEKVNILMVDDQPAKLLSYEVILSELGENLIKARCLFHKYTASRHVGATLVVARGWGAPGKAGRVLKGASP